MRPKLSNSITIVSFKSFYWLKTELVDFCRKTGISSFGKKQEIQKRIEHYLITGEKLSKQVNKQKNQLNKQYLIKLDTLIPDNYKNDTSHRIFFKSVIGERFKFNVVFMKWMQSNAGKTYQEAVNQWLKIEKDKKSGKKFKIGAQFEYNQYVRDFFKANPGMKRKDAIECWKYKKSLPGTNKFEFSDLDALIKN